ncbi:MAG TPA: PPE domain-containing protein [Actinophytocola sp.]|nr:PPE domain-containing protein [Actinophytocola sp.]
MDVPKGYDRDRLRQTWREEHGYSKKARKRAKNRTDERKANRKARRFGKVNWDAYQHEQLYDMIHKANPGQMYQRADQWNALAGRIEETTGKVQGVVEAVMRSWQGQAAVNAADANSRLMRWASTASHTANLVATGMSNYTEAVESAKRRMPKPGFATAERNFRDGYTVTLTGGPSDAVFLKELLSDGMVSHEEARARKAEAVEVMSSYETRSKDVHDTTPEFERAGATTKEPPVSPVGTPTPTPLPPPTGGTEQPTFPPTGSDVPGANASTTAAGFAEPLPGTGPGGGGPQSTGFGGGVGSLNGSGADSVRGGGLGSGAGVGAGGLAGRGPGGMMPGAVPGGVGGAAGARGAGAGAFGGMPFGGGANGEEDKEHKNKYDEGLDFFDDLPPAYPPVFGA